MLMGEPQGQDPGDDRAVLRVYLRWAVSARDALGLPHGSPPAGHIHDPMGRGLELAFSIDRGPGRRQRHFVAVSCDSVVPSRWLLQRLAPGVWDVPTSIHVPGQFHGFVTLLGVPEPAPWERP